MIPVCGGDCSKKVGPAYLGQYVQPQGEPCSMRHEINPFFHCDMIQCVNFSSL